MVAYQRLALGVGQAQGLPLLPSGSSWTLKARFILPPFR